MVLDLPVSQYRDRWEVLELSFHCWVLWVGQKSIREAIDGFSENCSTAQRELEKAPSEPRGRERSKCEGRGCAR